MARFGFYKDLGWKRRWPPLNSPISVNISRVSHHWSTQPKGCVMAGTACTKWDPWPTAPKCIKSPSRLVVKSWPQISRLPDEMREKYKGQENDCCEVLGNFISISTFLETLPTISSIFCWWHESKMQTSLWNTASLLAIWGGWVKILNFGKAISFQKISWGSLQRMGWKPRSSYQKHPY